MVQIKSVYEFWTYAKIPSQLVVVSSILLNYAVPFARLPLAIAPVAPGSAWGAND